VSKIASYTVPEGTCRTRADKVLAAAFPGHSRAAFQRALEAGLVRADGKVIAQDDEVRGGQVLEFSLPETKPAELRPVEIPLDETSILKTVTETRAFYLGPVPRAPFNSMLLQELGGRVPKTVLLVPLQMMGRVVGVLYVDDAKVDLGERLFELQKLTAKAAMAFEILVLKNKILSM